MRRDLILALSGQWYARHNGVWSASAARPALAGPSLVLADFDAAPSGVLALDTKPQFASAVIEKRLRAEGNLDGEARVLPSRVLALGGGCRVLYTAVPVSAWQQMFGWLEQEPAIALVYPLDVAMQALAARHDALLLRVGRQFRLLVSQPEALFHVATSAYSDDVDDLDTALQNLAGQARAAWDHAAQRPTVLWCDLLAGAGPDAERDDAALVARFAASLNASVVVAPSVVFDGPAGRVKTAADIVVAALSWRQAANPWPQRGTALVDQWRKPLALACATLGVALLALAGFWTAQRWQMQQRGADMQSAAVRLLDSGAGLDGPPATILAKHAGLMDFIDTLALAERGAEPLDMLADVRLAAAERVRVLRVRLSGAGGAFRIDGVPLAGDGNDRALTAFLQAMVARGYQVRAEDPGNQSAQPGFFSYTMRRTAATDGVH